MAAHAAAGVDDDLAAGEARVAVGPTDHKAAGGIDEVAGGLVQEPGGLKDRLDHLFDHRLPELVVGDVGVVLVVDDHRINSAGRVAPRFL